MRRNVSNRKVRSKTTSTGRTVVYCIVVIVCFAALFSGFTKQFGFSQRLTLEFMGPVQSFFTRISSGVSQLKNRYAIFINEREENKKLKETIARKQELIDKFREGYIRYIQLEEQLDFKTSLEAEYSVSARVVGRDPSFWTQTLIVDRGENDGVAEGMVARTSEGVVGQIIKTSDNYSKILLANAPSSAIDCMVQKNRVRGILKGRGKDGYSLHYVLKKADVEVGDYIVTAGISGFFKSGVPLGRVADVRKMRRGMFLEIDVEPSVDFQRLETVVISVAERQLIEKEMELETE